MPNSRETLHPTGCVSQSQSGKRAFTLIELLVVLAVMGLMMGFIGLTLLGGGGEELGSAQRDVLGLVQQARTRAALSGAETRLIVHSTEGDQEKYHRYVELVVKDTCATTNQSTWLVMGEGTTLPDGVFFVPEDDSICEVSDEWKEDAYTVWSSNDDDFELMDTFKGERKEGSGTKFRFLAFSPMGSVVYPSANGGGSTQKSPKLVIANGSLNPISTGKPIRFIDPDTIAGILMRRFGGFAVLSPEDFKSP
jgi:prepilin-type N-terminal cleavage/methylation domain-containing protein